MISELVLRYFDCGLEFVFFFSAVTLAFQLFTRKLCLQFSGLRMRNFTWNRFPMKNCWPIPCLHPSWRVGLHTWICICASLNHRKKTKAKRSRLIPRKNTETLVVLLSEATLIRVLSERRRTSTMLVQTGRVSQLAGGCFYDVTQDLVGSD